MLQKYKINKLKLNKTPTPPYPTNNGAIQFINALSKKIQVSINLKWTYARFMPFIV